MERKMPVMEALTPPQPKAGDCRGRGGGGGGLRDHKGSTMAQTCADHVWLGRGSL